MDLALAQRVGKGREAFVIPLKIDDLASDETTFESPRLNSIDFRGESVGGLVKLLEKLQKDGVPKDPRFKAAAVANWWQATALEFSVPLVTRNGSDFNHIAGLVLINPFATRI